MSVALIHTRLVDKAVLSISRKALQIDLQATHGKLNTWENGNHSIFALAQRLKRQLCFIWR